jgi:hypothetical protein
VTLVANPPIEIFEEWSAQESVVRNMKVQQ